MGVLHKIKKSREGWKKKAFVRGKEIRNQRRELKSTKEENQKLKKENEKLKEDLNNTTNQTPLAQLGDNKFQIFYLILLFFIFGKISFRAIARILGIIGYLFNLGHTPCVQTCINVVTKLAIAKMLLVKNIVTEKNPANPFSNGWMWMLDTTIGLASGKILAVLAFPANFFAKNNRAPTLDDVHVVGIAVAKSWTGENISEFLKEIISVIGYPIAFIKDGGLDLAKASSFLNANGLPILNIADISHVIANALRHYYENHPLMQTFLSACGQASSNFKQSILACLFPPALKTKARFMNLILLVKWAEKILKHSPVGRAVEGSLIEKLRKYIGELPLCKSFVISFLANSRPLIACQEILKNNGLSQITYKQCIRILSEIPTSSIRLEFTEWLNSQLILAEQLILDKSGMIITSDLIESFFAKIKMHGTGSIQDPNQMAIRAAAFCGGLTVADVQKAMEITTADVNAFRGNVETLTKQRRRHLANPGHLEELANAAPDEYIRFIPGLKVDFKNPNKVDISTKIENKKGPEIIKNDLECKFA
jgi:hypothetical protein